MIGQPAIRWHLHIFPFVANRLDEETGIDVPRLEGSARIAAMKEAVSMIQNQSTLGLS